MQLFTKLRDFSLGLLKPSKIHGRSIRFIVDTDGEQFICRLPGLSLSATAPTIGAAYDNLQQQIRDAEFAFRGNTDKEVFSEISSIQSTEIFNRGVRKKAVVFLGISILFFCLTIAVVPTVTTIMDIKHDLPKFSSRMIVQSISATAKHIEEIKPQSREKLGDEIATIRRFVSEVFSENNYKKDND